MAVLDRHDGEVGCEEAQLLMLPIWLNDPGMSDRERREFEAHLSICPACREEYAEARRLTPLVKRHWGPIGEDAQRLLLRAGYETDARRPSGKRERPMTVEEGWEDLKRRCPSLAEACRRQERKREQRRLMWRVGSLAAAASIVVAIGVGWMTSRKGESLQSGTVVAADSDRTSANAVVELVTPQGRKALVPGRPVTTDDQPQEILLGGMHRVVVNRHTQAAFGTVEAPVREGGAPRDYKVPPEGPFRAYEIQLARGELYVEVLTGHPFTVRTDNALLRITGTRFDVRAEGGRTELVLLKGSVQFSRLEDAERSVHVCTGQASTIVGHLAPTIPRATDAAAATAWARELALTNAIARARPSVDLHLLESIRDYQPQPKPLDLDSIDYEKWRDDHRDWFASEFPWIFQVQNVLKERHGIDADYVELLMVSGDIWQFNYPRPVNCPIPVFDPAAVKRIAEHYKVEHTHLLRATEAFSSNPLAGNRAAAPSARGKMTPAEAYLAALKSWRSDIASAAGGAGSTLSDDLLMFSLHAGVYLANTRATAYLWVKTNPKKAESLLAQTGYPYASRVGHGDQTIETLDAWTRHLGHEAAIAQACDQGARELFTAPRASGCGAETSTLVKQLEESLSALTTGRAR